jgi:hypothetical protein
MPESDDRVPSIRQRNSNAVPERPELAPMGNWPPPADGVVERWDQYARRQMGRILLGRAVAEWQDGEDRRRDIASAIEQGERSSGKATVSEGGPLPKTWREAIPYVVWVVLVLGFGLEFVAALVHGEWVRAGVSFAGLVGLMAAALHGNQIRSWIARTNPNWLYPGLLVLLLGIILSPFIEEKRWPLSAWFQTSGPPIVIHDPPTQEQIDKAAGDGIRQRDAQIAQLNLALQQRQPSSPPGPVSPPPLATRAPGDADREIPVLDEIYNVITTEAAPQPQEGTTLVGTWLAALQEGKGDDYLSRLAEFRSRVTKVDNDIVQAVLKRQIYCANDLCEILGARPGDGVANAIDRFRNLFAGFYKMADPNKTKEIRPPHLGLGGGAYNDVSTLLDPHLKPVYDALNVYQNWVSSTTNKLVARREELSKIASRQP